MSNSNSELIEDYLHDAHAHGFFDQMHEKVSDIKRREKNLDSSAAYGIAFNELLAEKNGKKINFDFNFLMDDDSSDT